jgi:hypothetical protein
LIPYLFSFLLPVLALAALLQAAALRFTHRAARTRATVVSIVAGAVICAIPIGGVPLARMAIGFNANFSMTSSALLVSLIAARAGWRRLLDDESHLAAWVFTLCCGALLYPLCLGLGGWDPYVAGWGFSWPHILTMTAAIALTWRNNRFAIVLIVAGLATVLGLQESANLWDYLVDPFVFIAAAGILTVRTIRRAISARLTKAEPS